MRHTPQHGGKAIDRGGKFHSYPVNNRNDGRITRFDDRGSKNASQGNDFKRERQSSTSRKRKIRTDLAARRGGRESEFESSSEDSFRMFCLTHPWRVRSPIRLHSITSHGSGDRLMRMKAITGRVLHSVTNNVTVSTLAKSALLHDATSHSELIAVECQ